MKNIDEWHKIGGELTSMFGICDCQRKLKTIVDNLWEIKRKNEEVYQNGGKRDFTGAEWLLLAIMETAENELKGAVTHGINCEYPIIILDHPFWLWIDEVKNNPNLEDN